MLYRLTVKTGLCPPRRSLKLDVHKTSLREGIDSEDHQAFPSHPAEGWLGRLISRIPPLRQVPYGIAFISTKLEVNSVAETGFPNK